MIRKHIGTFAMTTISLAIVAASAQAHTSVVSTYPMYQTAVSKLPEFAKVTFGSPLTNASGTNANKLVVTSPDGSLASIGDTSVNTSELTVRLDPNNIQQGVFDVNYRAIVDDGHVVSGSYQFAVSKDGVFPKNQTSTTTTPASADHNSFLHIHQTHIYQTIAALFLIGAWALYRRRSN